MSGNRGDCEHGHATEVLEMARVIGADHGRKITSAALVMIADGGEPITIGVFNTRGLWQMAGTLLHDCGEHKPDGCASCDPSALAAKDALKTLLKGFEFHQARHVAGKRSL